MFSLFRIIFHQIRKTSKSNQLTRKEADNAYKENPIWDLPKAACRGKPLGLSEDDKIIYDS